MKMLEWTVREQILDSEQIGLSYMGYELYFVTDFVRKTVSDADPDLYNKSRIRIRMERYKSGSRT